MGLVLTCIKRICRACFCIKNCRSVGLVSALRRFHGGFKKDKRGAGEVYTLRLVTEKR